MWLFSFTIPKGFTLNFASYVGKMRISVDDNKVYEIFRLEIKFVEISGWGRLIGKGWCNGPPLGTRNLKTLSE